MNFRKTAPSTVLLAALFNALIVTNGFTLENGLCRTPVLGFNTWNAFGGEITDSKLRAVVDSMVSKGFRDAGYTQFNLDDGPYDTSATTAFPNGLKPFADYVHSKGMKLGVYGRAYTEQDWLISLIKKCHAEYVKYDNLAVGPTATEYATFETKLKTVGYPVVYSAHWSGQAVTQAYSDRTNMIRTGGDIIWNPSTTEGTGGWDWVITCALQNTFGSKGFTDDITNAVDGSKEFWKFARPGYQNDADMMVVGVRKSTSNLSYTHDQEVSQISLWAIMASPILVGCDVRTISDSSKMVYLNKEVIAVHQDSLCIQGYPINVPTPRGSSWDKYPQQMVWPKRLANGTVAVVLYNNSWTSRQITVAWTDLGLSSTVKARVRDLWKHVDKGEFAGQYTSAMINAFGSEMIVISSGSTKINGGKLQTRVSPTRPIGGKRLLIVDKNRSPHVEVVFPKSLPSGASADVAGHVLGRNTVATERLSEERTAVR